MKVSSSRLKELINEEVKLFFEKKKFRKYAKRWGRAKRVLKKGVWPKEDAPMFDSFDDFYAAIRAAEEEGWGKPKKVLGWGLGRRQKYGFDYRWGKRHRKAYTMLANRPDVEAEEITPGEEKYIKQQRDSFKGPKRVDKGTATRTAKAIAKQERYTYMLEKAKKKLAKTTDPKSKAALKEKIAELTKMRDEQVAIAKGTTQEDKTYEAAVKKLSPEQQKKFQKAKKRWKLSSKDAYGFAVKHSGAPEAIKKQLAKKKAAPVKHPTITTSTRSLKYLPQREKDIYKKIASAEKWGYKKVRLQKLLNKAIEQGWLPSSGVEALKDKVPPFIYAQLKGMEQKSPRAIATSQ